MILQERHAHTSAPPPLPLVGGWTATVCSLASTENGDARQRDECGCISRGELDGLLYAPTLLLLLYTTTTVLLDCRVVSNTSVTLWRPPPLFTGPPPIDLGRFDIFNGPSNTEGEGALGRGRTRAHARTS